MLAALLGRGHAAARGAAGAGVLLLQWRRPAGAGEGEEVMPGRCCCTGRCCAGCGYYSWCVGPAQVQAAQTASGQPLMREGRGRLERL